MDGDNKKGFISDSRMVLYEQRIQSDYYTMKLS